MSSNNKDIVDLIVEINDSLRNNPMLETIAKLIIAKRQKRNIARNRELSESETEQINNVASLATLPAPAPSPASVTPAPSPASVTPAPSPAPAPASVTPTPAPSPAPVTHTPAPAPAPASVPAPVTPAPSSSIPSYSDTRYTIDEFISNNTKYNDLLTEDEMNIKRDLKDCINDIKNCTPKILFETINNLFKYLRINKEFKYNGSTATAVATGGISNTSDTDFTLFDLETYVSCESTGTARGTRTCRFKEPIDSKIKLLQIYLIKLVQISIELYKKQNFDYNHNIYNLNVIGTIMSTVKKNDSVILTNILDATYSFELNFEYNPVKMANNLDINNFLDNGDYDTYYNMLFELSEFSDKVDILNNFIKDLRDKTQTDLKKIISDLFSYMRERQKFMYNGIAGAGIGKSTDFTFDDVNTYKQGSLTGWTYPDLQDLSESQRLCRLYLMALCNIALASTNKLDKKKEKILTSVLASPDDTLLKKKITDYDEFIKIGKDHDRMGIGTDLLNLIGGSINDPYYQKYLKYKDKYLKLKTSKF